MTHSITVEPLFFGPLTPDWTIRELLDWIGADDDRCHDERLAGILDAAVCAVGAEPLAPGVGVVARVRLLASSVAADPAVGERTLDGVVSGGDVGSVARSAEESGVLVRV